jgi:hypothetical protein
MGHPVYTYIQIYVPSEILQKLILATVQYYLHLIYGHNLWFGYYKDLSIWTPSTKEKPENVFFVYCMKRNVYQLIIDVLFL